ncbi:hypothetical protein HDU76_010568, partial [Blyttiomyces sp. JEL0837]
MPSHLLTTNGTPTVSTSTPPSSTSKFQQQQQQTPLSPIDPPRSAPILSQPFAPWMGPTPFYHLHAHHDLPSLPHCHVNNTSSTGSSGNPIDMSGKVKSSLVPGAQPFIMPSSPSHQNTACPIPIPVPAPASAPNSTNSQLQAHAIIPSSSLPPPVTATTIDLNTINKTTTTTTTITPPVHPFPETHVLPVQFRKKYLLGSCLGSGGFGFVCSSIRRCDNVDVAVKFILKEKVPATAWARDETLGVVPTEVYFLKH